MERLEKVEKRLARDYATLDPALITFVFMVVCPIMYIVAVILKMAYMDTWPFLDLVAGYVYAVYISVVLLYVAQSRSEGGFAGAAFWTGLFETVASVGLFLWVMVDHIQCNNMQEDAKNAGQQCLSSDTCPLDAKYSSTLHGVCLNIHQHGTAMLSFSYIMLIVYTGASIWTLHTSYQLGHTLARAQKQLSVIQIDKAKLTAAMGLIAAILAKMNGLTKDDKTIHDLLALVGAEEVNPVSMAHMLAERVNGPLQQLHNMATQNAHKAKAIHTGHAFDEVHHLE